MCVNDVSNGSEQSEYSTVCAAVVPLSAASEYDRPKRKEK